MKAEIERRPMVAIAIGLAFGLVAPHLWAALIATATALFLRSWPCRIGLVAAFFIGIALTPPPPNQSVLLPDPGARIHAIGTVVSTPGLYKTICVANVSCDSGIYRVSTEEELVYGEFIEFSGRLSLLREGMETSPNFRGVVGRVSVAKGDIKRLSDTALPFRMGHAWKTSFASFVDSTIDPIQGRVVRAITFNMDEGLGSELRENLQRTGTIHIISASGAHVLIFAVGLAFLLSSAPIPRSAQLAILIATLSIYALAAGFRPPIVRAVVMAAIGYFAYIWRREPDLLSALAISLIAYLIWMPASIYDPGLQLSFVTVGALALYCRFDASGERSLGGRLVQNAKGLLKASFVAWAGSAPLVAYYFGSISLISVPANFAIAGIVAPLMIFALLAHGLSFFAWHLALGLMKGVVAPLAACLEGIVSGLGPLQFAATTVPEFPAWWIAVYYLPFLVFWRPIARKA